MIDVTSDKHLVIVGAGGMLGHRLVQEFCRHSDYDVHATLRTMIPASFANARATYHTEVDLAFDTSKIRNLLQEIRPEIVINAAGVIKHRAAGADPDLSMSINGALPHTLGITATEIGARLIHISTDCVYSGQREDGGYSEAEAPDAVDVYGRSKAVGEVDWGGHLTVRTSIIGFELANHLGLLGWLFGNTSGVTVQGYERAIYSGLPTSTLARTIRHVIAELPQMRGLYHVASRPINKYELVKRLNDAFALGLKVVPASRVVCNRALNDSRFRSESGLLRPTWDQLIDDLLADYQDLPYAEVGYRTGLTTPMNEG
jgi:dTDP-4-dehydrorhamnose reductase